MALGDKEKCKIEFCEKPAKAKKMCDMHYQRLRRNKTLELKVVRVDISTLSYCLVFNCENEPAKRGVCDYHYSVWERTGSPIKPKIIKKCGVEGCERPFDGRGMCIYHYKKFKENLALIGMNDFPKD